MANRLAMKFKVQPYLWYRVVVFKSTNLYIVRSQIRFNTGHADKWTCGDDFKEYLSYEDAVIAACQWAAGAVHTMKEKGVFGISDEELFKGE